MTKVLVLLCALAAPLLLPLGLSAAPAAEVPVGTHFLVELRDKLDAKKIKVGKKFKAETLEALQASGGNIVPAGAKLKGHVSFVEYNKMMLRFERIECKSGKLPIVATVSRVLVEKGISGKVGEEGEEGEIRTQHSRARGAIAGAAIGAGVGAAVGASQGGKRGAGIGAAIGAGAGGVVGAIIGSGDLVLQKGTRLELELARPLLFEPRR
jgi:hypothetical protein